MIGVSCKSYNEKCAQNVCVIDGESSNISLNFFELSHRNVKAIPMIISPHQKLTQTIFKTFYQIRNLTYLFFVHRNIGGRASRSSGTEETCNSYEYQQMGRRRRGRCQSKFMSNVCIYVELLLFFMRSHTQHRCLNWFCFTFVRISFHFSIGCSVVTFHYFPRRRFIH